MDGKGRGKLLVVEDENLLRRLIAEFLRTEGFEVVEAADGLEGAGAFEGQGPFDLVLLDLNLPYLSGVDVCRQIKAQQPLQPVLICSAAILDNHVAALHALNVDQFLTKPYHPLDLLDRITVEMSRANSTQCEPVHTAMTTASWVPKSQCRSILQRLKLWSSDSLWIKMTSCSCAGLSRPRRSSRGTHTGTKRYRLCAKDGFMAGKPLNRLDLRRQREAAEPLDPMEDETDEVVEDVEEEEVADRRPKKKPKAPPKSKAKSSRSAKPAARMRIVWAVLNDAFKPVATFEYSQKPAAEARAAELTAKGKGTHFVVKTKEPMPEDAPGIGAAIPRVVTPPAKAARKEVEAPIEEEEEIEEDEDNDIDMGDDGGDDDE